jgi:hypothetical protein
MARKPINEITGPNGTWLNSLRNTDEELDNALMRPISNSDKRERETDVKITKRLVDHGWDKHHIRKVINKRHNRDKLMFNTSDDSYIEGVLTDSGYNVRTFDSHGSDDDDDDDDDREFDFDGSSLNLTDSQREKFSKIKF